MRTALLTITLALAVLAGCATTSLPMHEMRDAPAERVLWQPPPQAAATLVVARDMGMSGSGLVVRVTVDGRPAGDLLPSERLVLRVEPGRRLVAVGAMHVGMEARKPRTVDVTVDGGGQALVRVGFDDMSGAMLAWQDQAAH